MKFIIILQTTLITFVLLSLEYKINSLKLNTNQDAFSSSESKTNTKSQTITPIAPATTATVTNTKEETPINKITKSNTNSKKTTVKKQDENTDDNENLTDANTKDPTNIPEGTDRSWMQTEIDETPLKSPNVKDFFQSINKTIIENEDFIHQAYNKTVLIANEFGSRMYGSNNLNLALRKIKKMMISDGFTNVKLEEIYDVPIWTRGEEYLSIILAEGQGKDTIKIKLNMLGLGYSVGGNITAQIVMVRNFNELKYKEYEEIEGKIVFFNFKWTNYHEVAKYRLYGADKAAKKGAVGVIIRSVSPTSDRDNAHTGLVDYSSGIGSAGTVGIKRIPACAVSNEDADLIERYLKTNSNNIYSNSNTIKANLFMSAKFSTKNTTSFNVVGDYKGNTKPEDIVLLGGHLDSWDISPGASDDLAGFFVCYEAVRVMIKNKLKNDRTLRVIGWAGEETGLSNNGANSYAKRHANELKDHMIAFESDTGTTKPYSFGYSGDEIGYAFVYPIQRYFFNRKEIPAVELMYDSGLSADTEPLYNKGIPVMRNIVNKTLDASEYFTTHHTKVDNVSKLNPGELDLNTNYIAKFMCSLANVNFKLPHYIPKEESRSRRRRRE